MNNHRNLKHNKDQEDTHGANAHLLRMFSKASTVNLTPEEKIEGENSFRNFIEKNPHPAIKSPYKHKIPVLSPSVFYKEKMQKIFAYIKSENCKVACIPLAILLFSIAGISYAAQDSVPGELLYPVKIQVNERVERALALTPEEKARVAVRQTITRLEEVKKLIDANKYDEQNEKTINANFEYHFKDVEKNTEQLAKDGHADIAAKINSDFGQQISQRMQTINEALHSMIPRNTGDGLINTQKNFMETDIIKSGKSNTQRHYPSIEEFKHLDKNEREYGTSSNSKHSSPIIRVNVIQQVQTSGEASGTANKDDHETSLKIILPVPVHYISSGGTENNASQGETSQHSSVSLPLPTIQLP